MRTILMAIAFFGGVSSASPDDRVDLSKEKNAILDAVSASREKLITGAFEASGRVTREYENGHVLMGETSIFCAFDWKERHLRSNREEPALMVDDGVDRGEAADDANPREVRLSRHVIRNGDKIYDWHSDGVREIRVTDAAAGFPGAMCLPFDVRTIGLGSVPELEAYKEFDELIALLHRETCTAVEQEGERFYRVEWIHPGERVQGRSTIWFDSTQGMSPVRMQVHVRSGDGPWGEPVEECQASWTEIGGAWVPVSADVSQVSASGKRTRYQLAFAWEGINEPVDPSLFDPRSIVEYNRLEHARIVDARLGVPVVVERIGNRDEVVTAPLKHDVAGRDRRFWILVAVNAAAAAIIAIFVIWRRLGGSLRSWHR